MRGKISLDYIHSKAFQVHNPRLGASKLLKAAPLRCLGSCPCRCHYRSIVRSPRHLSSYLRDFFLGCSNLPWHFSGYAQCNEQTCRRSRNSAAEVRYFPPWFSYTTATLSVSFTLPALSLKLSLQTHHIIPYHSPILTCVQEGDIEEMRKLLRSGLATSISQQYRSVRSRSTLRRETDAQSTRHTVHLRLVVAVRLILLFEGFRS